MFDHIYFYWKFDLRPSCWRSLSDPGVVLYSWLFFIVGVKDAGHES